MTYRMTPTDMALVYLEQTDDKMILDDFFRRRVAEIAEDVLRQCDEQLDAAMIDAVSAELHKRHGWLVREIISFLNGDDVIRWGGFARAVIDHNQDVWVTHGTGSDTELKPLSADQRESLARWAASH